MRARMAETGGDKGGGLSIIETVWGVLKVKNGPGGVILHIK
jgi:hypothetical protein